MSQAVVLLVEDEPPLRQLFTFTLQQENLIVLPTCRAAEALQVFRSHGNINLLVTDVQLEDMTGFELAERILEEKPGTKVLIMSGSPETEGLAAEKGYYFLAKPFFPATLKDRVLELLAGKIPAQSAMIPKQRKMTG
jgi:CheY-like chemotaxis protein